MVTTIMIQSLLAANYWRRAVLSLVAVIFLVGHAIGADQLIHYKGVDGPGKGKRIVFVSGDEEYRSEEALPQLAKILATEHGFDCTVLFAIDPKTGLVNPNHVQNIAGLDSLKKADLMVLFVRRRHLPDEQLQLIDDYARSGKPIIGIRTATHAFQAPANSKFAHYDDSYGGDKKQWEGGFGRVVLGERWVNHHGKHKHESTRGVIAPGAAGHPILRGIKSGEIWCPSDVYEVRLPLPGDSRPLVLGEVVARKGEFDENDRLYGMRPEDDSPVSAKNNPMMPVAWTKSYELPGGKKGRAFTSTMGASVDLLNEPLRRLLANAAYWCVGLEENIPSGGTRVDIVGEYEPTKFEFRKDDYWAKREMSLDEFRLDEAAK
jgi:type 1 glutamine amidotransferase